MVKVFIPAIGSIGDVLPYVALGKELKKKGYEVRIGAHERWRKLIEDHEFFLIEGDLDHELRYTDAGRQVQKSGGIRGVKRVKQLMIELMSKWFAGCINGSKGCDSVFLTGTSFVAGISVLDVYPQKLGMCVFKYPATPTKYYTPPMMGLSSSESATGIANKLKWKLADYSVNSTYLSRINELREKVNLPPIRDGFRDHLQRIRAEPIPIITAYSKYLLPRPMDWGANDHMVGPFYLEDLESYQPPKELEDFISTGEKPVYFGFESETAFRMVDYSLHSSGSLMGAMMPTKEQHKIINMWIEVVRQTKIRAVIDIKGINEPEAFTKKRVRSVFFLDHFVPHAWLFPKCYAAVHQGSSGTTHASIMNGLPTLVLPYGADQPFNGHRVYVNGLGPQPIKMNKLSIKKLVRAVNDLVSNTKYKENAERIGRMIRDEGGIENTVRIFERYRTNPNAKRQTKPTGDIDVEEILPEHPEKGKGKLVEEKLQEPSKETIEEKKEHVPSTSQEAQSSAERPREVVV